ncbi:FG-GAP repeat protein [Oceanibacterium hippocampi]|uniref:FG-GAP repeat protein n=1 Tax=Oceanibacterium hippocampi TaxID=745714 RepID=A0A1Y5TDN3_9PROT|nr:FG-GAP repeat protein [Oceanibacterium hippocampi]
MALRGRFGIVGSVMLLAVVWWRPTSAAAFSVLQAGGLPPDMQIAGGADGIFLNAPGTARYRVVIRDFALALEPAGAAPVAPDGDDEILPDGTVRAARGRLVAAWLAEPTDRYRHGVLGDAIEAGALHARLADGTVVAFRLDDGSVFEDLYPRPVDIDGDGNDELLTVRSYPDRGAALVLLGLAGSALDLIAEGPAIGQPNRWLDPVGMGDFDGDGRSELAAVLTPHIGGVLTVYRRDGARLVPRYRAEGYSSHRIGSRVLGQSAVLDVDGDGVDDIVLPDATRRAMRVVSFPEGRFRELGHVAHDAEIVSDIATGDIDGDGIRDVAYVLGDGTLVVLKPKR